MSSRHTAVFFDLGGTLFSYKDVGQRAGSVIIEAARRLGVDPESRQIGRAYRKASAEAYARHGSKPYYLHRDLFGDTIRAFASEFGHEASDEFLEWFHGAQRASVLERLRPREDCHDTLRALRERGLYTSIVSNIDDDYLIPLVQDWELEELLDHWTSSEEAQSCKPDRAFFELALKKAGRAPEEVIFVGDSPEHDIQGARRMGMTSILIVEDGMPPPLQSGEVDVEPHHEVKSLSELLQLIE